jgi:nitroreductase
VSTPIEQVRALVKTRQFREFTDDPPTDAELEAMTEVARWTGSSKNSQPLRYIVIRDPAMLERIHDAGVPQTRSLKSAPAAIAIVQPNEPSAAISLAYDEGRAAERLLVAAVSIGLGAGIGWIRSDVRPAISELLGLPADRFVRTIVAVGHPTEAARRPKAAPGTGRLPADEVVFRERWPQD